MLKLFGHNAFVYVQLLGGTSKSGYGAHPCDRRLRQRGVFVRQFGETAAAVRLRLRLRLRQSLIIFSPKCAHTKLSRGLIAQERCAHRPFSCGCAQQKRILRYLWPVSRAHFGERRRSPLCWPRKGWVRRFIPFASINRPFSRVLLPRQAPHSSPILLASTK